MILKASQRSGAKQLAMHLLNDENEHITVHDIRGFISDDLLSAFKEMQAVSKGTQCKKFMFSLSLNPPAHESASVDDFEKAINRIEEELNIKDQPRCIVFHEKEGRRHCHAVWSRIDGEEMKAIKLPYFKQQLNGIAKELYIEHGWDLPKGFISKELSDPRNFTLAEWQQAKRLKIDPREIKNALQQCWKASDNKASFENAIRERGFFLARGDRRGYVALDWRGEVYSLSRSLSVKTKALKERLGEVSDLLSIEKVKQHIAKNHIKLHQQFSKELNLQHEFARKPLFDQRTAMQQQHREAREHLRQQQEDRALLEQQARQGKIRKGLLGLWDFITGKSRKQHKRNEQEAKASEHRDRQEKERLVIQQLNQRKALQTELIALREEQKKETQSLNDSFANTLEALNYEP
ncbi:relaxase [Marinomonas agarivorans]|nr:relaxase [Marinomonas agarivorans]